MSAPEPESFGFQAEISQLLDLIISKSYYLCVIIDATPNPPQPSFRHFLLQQRNFPP